MADSYFFPHSQSQEGWSHPTATPAVNFEWNWFNSVAIESGRYFLTRFGDVSLPVGATISAARIIYRLDAKNPGDLQSMTYDHFFQATSAGGSTVQQDTIPLRENHAEETASERAWTQHVNDATYNWPVTAAGVKNEVYVDVTSQLQNAWTNGGRHMALTFMMYIVSETADLFMNNHATFAPVTLHVTWTGGVTENSIVLVNENPNFVMGTVTEDSGFVRPNMYRFNPLFGTFGEPVTYQVMANDGAITAPFGGNICKITAGEAGVHTAIFLEILGSGDYGGVTRLVPGEWLTLTASAYVPTGLDQVKAVTFPATKDDFFMTTGSIHDAWARMQITFQYSLDYGTLAGFQTNLTPPTLGQSWYLANVNLTRGRQSYPHLDGNTADSGTYGRNYEWGGGNSGKRNGGFGYVLINSVPSATITTPLPTGSTQKGIQVFWTYNDPTGEPQLGYHLEARKKKVQG